MENTQTYPPAAPEPRVMGRKGDFGSAPFAVVQADQRAVLAGFAALLRAAEAYLGAHGHDHRFGRELRGWMHSLETAHGLLSSQAV
jgi:hypothetical protein